MGSPNVIEVMKLLVSVSVLFNAIMAIANG